MASAGGDRGDGVPVPDVHRDGMRVPGGLPGGHLPLLLLLAGGAAGLVRAGRQPGLHVQPRARQAHLQPDGDQQVPPLGAAALQPGVVAVPPPQKSDGNIFRLATKHISRFSHFFLEGGELFKYSNLFFFYRPNQICMPTHKGKWRADTTHHNTPMDFAYEARIFCIVGFDKKKKEAGPLNST